MQIKVLGTGTSQGIPVIACQCPVCHSTDPRDNRLRCSIYVKTDMGEEIVVDIGPDFRQQILRAGIDNLDALLLTHEHNDHIIGLDDIRPFNFMLRKNMPVFAEKRVQAELLQRFAYIFDKNPYPGAPRVQLHTISDDQEIRIGDSQVVPIRALHGKLPVLGFRFGDFTYITDARTIPPESMEKVRGSRVLILNALRRKEHHSHFNLDQAIDITEKLEVEKAYLIHISHAMGLHAEVEEELPSHISLAYDGLEINL